MESEHQEQAKAIMAFTMDERCAVLKEFGAQFHTSVDNCPDIPKSLEEGIAVRKRYEEVMNKIGPGSGLEREFVYDTTTRCTPNSSITVYNNLIASHPEDSPNDC